MIKKFLEKNQIKNINWVKEISGWDKTKKNGYFFLGTFAPWKDEKWTFSDLSQFYIICFGMGKLYAIVKANFYNSNFELLYKEKENKKRDWNIIVEILEKNIKTNSLDAKKEVIEKINIENSIKNFSIKNLMLLKDFINQTIKEKKEKELQNKLNSYTNLGYENAWEKLPNILKDNPWQIHERTIRNCLKEKWIDQLKVKWMVDSSD